MTRESVTNRFPVQRQAVRPAVKTAYEFQQVDAIPPWDSAQLDLVEADNEDYTLRGVEFSLADSLKWMEGQLLKAFRAAAEEADDPSEITSDPEGLYPVATEIPTAKAVSALGKGFFIRYADWQPFAREALRRRTKPPAEPDYESLPSAVSLTDTTLLNRIKKTVLIRSLSVVFTGKMVSEVTERRKQTAREELRDAIEAASVHLTAKEIREVTAEAIGNIVEQPPAHSSVSHVSAGVEENEVDSAFKTPAYFNSRLAEDS